MWQEIRQFAFYAVFWLSAAAGAGSVGFLLGYWLGGMAR